MTHAFRHVVTVSAGLSAATETANTPGVTLPPSPYGAELLAETNLRGSSAVTAARSSLMWKPFNVAGLKSCGAAVQIGRWSKLTTKNHPNKQECYERRVDMLKSSELIQNIQ